MRGRRSGWGQGKYKDIIRRWKSLCTLEATHVEFREMLLAETGDLKERVKEGSAYSASVCGGVPRLVHSDARYGGSWLRVVVMADTVVVNKSGRFKSRSLNIGVE